MLTKIHHFPYSLIHILIFTLIPTLIPTVIPSGKDLPLHVRGSEGATANGTATPPTTVVLRMTEAEQEFVFEHVPAEPVRVCLCVRA
jgi:hypothetical protein